jgi:hypothetical protein
MDEIRELIGRLGQLSNEEFANLTELVRAKAGEIKDDDTSDEATALLSELADITDQIVAEKTARETKAQEAKEARESARERIKALEAQEEQEGEPETEETPEEPGEEETPEAEAEETETEETPAPEPVAATGAVQRMARRAPKPTPSPEAAPERTTGVLVAAGGYQAGKPITDRIELARLMHQAAWAQCSGNVHGLKQIVASAQLEYPAERKLTGDAEHNTEIIDAICRLPAQKYDRSGALVATGGICQPTNVDYSIPTLATAETPIVDALPSFEATRGGIRYIKPPDIAEWKGATSNWTEATDGEPAGATKPIKMLACGEEISVYVEAISTRLGFGNMQSRFAPEQVAANTDVAFAEASRVREENLLNLIEGIAVKKLETAQHLGAGRDLVSNVAFAVGAYRNIHRTPKSHMFTVLLPDMARELIRADLLREQAHDNSGSFNVWEVSDAQIDALFRQYGVNVIWHIDGQEEPASKNYESQYAVAANVAEGKKLDEIFPAKAWETKGLSWYFFPEGAVQRLDAGRLDLGVVRDSTLDATNDYEIFAEVFEGIANRAFSKGVWQVLSIVKATGGSAATVTAVAP